MIMYLLALASSFVLAYLHDACLRQEKADGMGAAKPLSDVFWFLSALPLLVVAGIRSGVGVDQALYKNEFDIIASGLNYYVHSEEGFQFLNSIIAACTDDPMWLFFVCSAVFIFGTWYLAREFEDTLAIMVMLLFVTFNYLQSFSLIAQYTALGVICVGMRFLLQGKCLRSTLVLLVAVGLHASAAVFLPFVPFYAVLCRVERPLRLIVISAVCVGVMSLFMGTLAPWVLRGTRFYVYFTVHSDQAGLNSTSQTIISIAVFVMMLMLLRSSKALSGNPKYLLLFFLQCVALCFSLVQGQVTLLVRLLMYFTFFQIFSIPVFCREMHNRRYRSLLLAGVVVAFCIWLLVYPIRNNYYAILPYRTVFERSL